MSLKRCEEIESPPRTEAPAPASNRPIPKPRTKLPPDSKKLEAINNKTPRKEGSPTTSTDHGPPPPRPPPPKLASKPIVSALSAPKLPPRPMSLSPMSPEINKSPSPPPLPPRHMAGACPVLPRPVLPSMEGPVLPHLELSLGPTNPPYPLEDLLPPHPPKFGWKSPWSSAEDPMEPLPDLPSGAIFRPDSKEFDGVVERLPVNLVPDRPALPSYFEPPQEGPLTISNAMNLSLDEPLSLENSLTPPHETTSPLGYFDAGNENVDYIENPIYLRLDSFGPRTFQSTSKNAFHGYSETLNDVDMAVNLPYVNPAHPSTVLPSRPLQECNISTESPQNNGFASRLVNFSSLSVVRPSSIMLPEKTLPSLPRLPSSELSPGDETPTPPSLDSSGDVATPKNMSPSSISEDDPPTPKADDKVFFSVNNDDGPSNFSRLYPKLPIENIHFRHETPIGISEMYNGDHINTDSFLPSEEDLAHSIEPVICVDAENNPLSMDGTAVSYSGQAEYFYSKKDKKLAYVRLNHDRVAVYEDEEDSLPIAGPFDLFKAEFIGRQAETNTIVCRFSQSEENKDPKKTLKDKEAKRELRFTPTEHIDHWLLLLGQCRLSSWEDLRQSAASGLSACGRIWLRQGTTSQWAGAMAFLHQKMFSYLVQDHADVIYELDLRKVVSIKGNLDQSEWCPHVLNREKGGGKEKSVHGMGPFLITVEGGSLCLECDDVSAVVLWRRLLETALTSSSFDLNECRLTYEDIPVHIDKCIRFVTTYGLNQEGLYRKNGKVTEAKKIREALLQDPWEYHINHDGNDSVFAVADVLRQILRQLTSPLFPDQFHEDFFNIYRSTDMRSTKKYKEYKEVFQRTSFPLVNYSTIRRLIAHLCEVEENSEHTKASVENLAKVFGPTLFHVESQTSYEANAPLHLQIGVVADMMKGYTEIFDVTVRESISRERIHTMDIVARQHKKPAGNLLVPIHLWERDNRAFNVSSELVAEQVCAEAVRLRGFNGPVDSPYAIFEWILNGALSRRVAPHEKISTIVVGRWMQWKITDGYLLFDHDTHKYDQTANTFSGKVKVAEPNSKSFKSAEMAIEEGIKISMYRNNKHVQTWPIDETMWYSGVAASRKPPLAFSATFFLGTSSPLTDRSGWAVSWNTANERTQFMNAILRAQSRGMAPLLVRL